MRKLLVRLLTIQAMGALIVAAIIFVRAGLAAAGASIYGGVIGLLVSLLLAWRLTQMSQPDADLRGLYIGAFERMLFVAVAFGVAFGLLRLQPVPVIAGFGGAQLAYFAAAGPLRRYTLNIMGKKGNGR